MKLTYLVPVYNEKKTVVHLIAKLMSLPINKEIFVVDDGSTDGTRELLRHLKGITVIEHERNRGKGAAIATGINRIKDGIVVIQDADLELEPHETIGLAKKIRDIHKDVIYGTRIRSHRYFLTGPLICNKLLSFITNMLFRSDLTDVMTCYKIMHIDILSALDLESKGFDMETEITAKVLASGYKITEVPISYHSRPLDEGKKIRYKDSFGIGAMLLKIWVLAFFKKQRWVCRERHHDKIKQVETEEDEVGAPLS